MSSGLEEAAERVRSGTLPAGRCGTGGSAAGARLRGAPENRRAGRARLVFRTRPERRRRQRWYTRALPGSWKLASERGLS